MITDQNNKGIPGVTKSRVQLTTPIETANNGNLNSTSNPVSERYNPIQAKAPSTGNPSQDYQNLDFVNMNNAYPDTPAGKAQMYLERLTTDELTDILQKIADGSIKSRQDNATVSSYGTMQDAMARGQIASQNGGLSAVSGANNSMQRNYQYNNGNRVTANNGVPVTSQIRR